MATQKRGAPETTGQDEPSKAELQRHLEETREAIAHTVTEIKDTVSDQYEAVKDTVSGVLDWREQFQKDPIVWSVGALSAGFAVGYTLGYAHKNAKSHGRHQSQVAAFADSLIDEITAVGHSFVIPALNVKIKEMFGFDFAELLEGLGGAKKAVTKRSAKKKPGAKKSARRKGTAKKGVKRKGGPGQGRA